MNIPDIDEMEDIEILSWYTKTVVEVGRIENREKRYTAHQKLLVFKKRMNERFRENLNKQKSAK